MDPQLPQRCLPENQVLDPQPDIWAWIDSGHYLPDILGVIRSLRGSRPMLYAARLAVCRQWGRDIPFKVWRAH